MIKSDYESVNSFEELKQMYDMSRQELELAMECYSYAKSYLESIGKAGQWSLVDKHEFAFQKIVKEKNKIPVVAERKVFEACAAAVLQIDNVALRDRRYDIIPQMAKDIKPIIDVLRRDILPATAASNQQTDPFGFDVSEVGSDDLYKLEHECRKPDNIRRTVDIVSSVLEATSQTRRDQQASHALLNDLIEISMRLISVKNKDLDDRQEDMLAVKNQLQSIVDTCNEISKWVNRHEGHN